MMSMATPKMRVLIDQDLYERLERSIERERKAFKCGPVFRRHVVQRALETELVRRNLCLQKGERP